MSTLILAPAPLTSDDAADETHVVCCNRDLALCGSDVTELPWVGDEVEATCVVCRDLEGQPCPRCGQ
ncbi:hypothetical protein [Streptomyces sp. NPDC051016]|uniref:hypothetical protein n=1 Tax=Streptomyces sp. NPDC051016 TaxID=3365638 RepID=UPI0037AB6DA5